MEELQNKHLIIDVEYRPVLLEDEASELKLLQQRFIKSYIDNKDKMEVEDWLVNELKNNLPEKTYIEIAEMSKDIVETIKINEDNKKSLQEAINNGRSKESWFAASLKNSFSNFTTFQTAEYLHGLDKALESANESMHSTITTKSGLINQNVNLDGFIAEQHHVNSFNLQAELKGSEFRAEVLTPKEGQTYGKNSVDIVIKDKSGKIVKRYQSKYCADAESTQRALDNGDYRGQRKLVPEGQAKDINNATECIESPDGIKSQSLSKQKAKDLQQEAQSGNWNDLNWNEYKTKDLAIGIGKQAGYAALQGAAIGAGLELASKVWNGEEIKGEEVVEKAITSGADFGIKAATAGALKVGVEKGIIKVIPKGTPAGTIANIAYVAIENVKVLSKVATGELTLKAGFEKMEQTTVATVAGIAAGTKGTTLGAAIGSALGPVGAIVGGFVGGTVGYIAGSKVGETVVKVSQKIRNVVTSTLKSAASTVSSGVNNLCSSAKGIVSGVASLLGF